MYKIITIIITGCFLSGCRISSQHDQYGGLEVTKKNATGFFRVDKINGRWCFITPDGHPFFSTGVNTVKYKGTADKTKKQPFLKTNQNKYKIASNWSKASSSRLKKWGWNTLGAWSDWQLFRKKIPYTVILYIGGSDWEEGKITDCFDPEFRIKVKRILKKTALPLKDDPWLVGYFLDNEIRWGPDHRGGHIFYDYFSLSADCPGKKALIDFLKKHYQNIENLKKDFDVNVKNWSKLAESSNITPIKDSNAVETKHLWLGQVAENFFSILNEELKQVDPNHLNLGVRFIAQTVHPEVLKAAGRYLDVVSINYYEFKPQILAYLNVMDPEYLPTTDFLSEHYRICQRPILISEFGFRAADSGLPNTWPPIYPVYKNQTERAAAFKKYSAEALQKDWIIGFHWFEFADQPASGRFDGENNNWGLVNIKDEPYLPIIRQSQKNYSKIEKIFIDLN